MPKAKVKIKSNFKVAKEAGHDAVGLAIRKAVDAGTEVTKQKVDSQAGARGYDLHSSSVSSNVTPFDGAIMLGTPDEFWWRYFEYGTTRWAAMPMIRPGSRKARKVLKDELLDDFEKFISARAAVRGF